MNRASIQTVLQLRNSYRFGLGLGMQYHRRPDGKSHGGGGKQFSTWYLQVCFIWLHHSIKTFAVKQSLGGLYQIFSGST
jgi:hypothetical protein